MRAGINILSIIIPMAIVLMITVIAFAVYKISYKRKINKRLAEGRDADIKPMMSPVKFVVTTLLGTIIGLIIVWLIVISVFSAKVSKQKKELAVYPSIAFLRDEILDDSLFAGYKFGDDIKGYMHFSEKYDDTLLEIYVAKQGVYDMFPTILFASDYVGDRNKDDIIACERIKYSFYNENWGDILCPDSLVAIDVGGYKGEFTFSYDLYYSSDAEHFLNEEPDESYKFDFKIHESGAIACPQLGLTVDSWD